MPLGAKVDPPAPEFVRIAGVGDKVDTTEIAKGLEQFLGKPLDQEALGLALTRVTGDGLFSAVTYDAIRENGRDGLLVHVDEKLTGPPLLNFALEVSNRASKGLSFDPAFRVTMFNTLTKNSELRLDGSAGTRLGVAAEHYQRFGLSRFFVAPSIAAERRITEYFVDGEAMAEYQVRRYIAAADAGVRLNADTELRAGYIYGRVDLERGIGSEILPEFGGLERRTHILLRHDSQTSPFAPASGLLGGIEYSVLGSQSDSGGRLQPARGPRVAVLYRAQQGIVCSCSSAAEPRLARQRRFPTSSRSADCSGCPATRTTSFEGTTIFLAGPATCTVSVGSRTSSAADLCDAGARCGIGLRHVGCGTGTRQPWRRTRPGHADRSGVGADCVQQGRRIAILFSDGPYSSNSMRSPLPPLLNAAAEVETVRPMSNL